MKTNANQLTAKLLSTFNDHELTRELSRRRAEAQNVTDKKWDDLKLEIKKTGLIKEANWFDNNRLDFKFLDKKAGIIVNFFIFCNLNYIYDEDDYGISHGVGELEVTNKYFENVLLDTESLFDHWIDNKVEPFHSFYKKGYKQMEDKVVAFTTKVSNLAKKYNVDFDKVMEELQQ